MNDLKGFTDQTDDDALPYDFLGDRPVTMCRPDHGERVQEEQACRFEI